MRLTSLWLCPLLLALPLRLSATESTWRFDTVHTQVLFSVDHQGFSQSLGLFKLSEGFLAFDPSDWSTARVDVRIDTQSILLGDSKWEDTVRSWQFLNVKRWPEARYVSRRVEQVDAEHGVIHGELQLHGSTQPLDLQVRLNKIGNDPYAFRRTAGFSATAQLQRSAFGMSKVLSVVGDSVQLRIEATVVADRNAKPQEPHDEPQE